MAKYIGKPEEPGVVEDPSVLVMGGLNLDTGISENWIEYSCFF